MKERKKEDIQYYYKASKQISVSQWEGGAGCQEKENIYSNFWPEESDIDSSIESLMVPGEIKDPRWIEIPRQETNKKGDNIQGIYDRCSLNGATWW